MEHSHLHHPEDHKAALALALDHVELVEGLHREVAGVLHESGVRWDENVANRDGNALGTAHDEPKNAVLRVLVVLHRHAEFFPKRDAHVREHAAGCCALPNPLRSPHGVVLKADAHSKVSLHIDGCGRLAVNVEANQALVHTRCTSDPPMRDGRGVTGADSVLEDSRFAVVQLGARNGCAKSSDILCWDRNGTLGPHVVGERDRDHSRKREDHFGFVTVGYDEWSNEEGILCPDRRR
jgi:hypothetical protein